jgi:hypothetical protein
LTIAASVPGTGDGNVDGVVSFDPLRNNQRASLALVGGNVYICWASHCDWGPFHGWIMGYDAATMQQNYVLNTSPNDSEVGIWMSGSAPAGDTNGNIYLESANGPLTVTSYPQVNGFLTEAFLKLSPSTSNTLDVSSYFTPGDFATYDALDTDLGSCGVMLIPGTSLLVGSGKTGIIYLLDRDNMGGFTGTGGIELVQQEFLPIADGWHGVFGAPIWWDGPSGSYSYVWPSNSRLIQMPFLRDTSFFDSDNINFGASNIYNLPSGPGGILSVSANGTNAGSGIVWGTHALSGYSFGQTRPGILHAFNAEDVSQELWNSEMLPAKDRLFTQAKYVPPTIANGKVFVPTFSGTINVYGLFPGQSGPPVIQTEPSPLDPTRLQGANFSASVFVLGAMPISYQWSLNGTNIPDATNSGLYQTNIQMAQAGDYSCSISNAFGVTNSSTVSLSVIPVTNAYPQLVISDNPLAYYRLDETNGTVAHDYAGGFDGHYFNASLGQPGENPTDSDTGAGFGYASPTDSYVATPLNFYSPMPVQFSVEAWAKGGYQPMTMVTIVACGQGLKDEEFALGTSAGIDNREYQFNTRDMQSLAPTARGTGTTDNTWHHLVGVIDEVNGYIALYDNGLLNNIEFFNPDYPNSGGDGIQNGSYTVTIGGRPNGHGVPVNFTFKGTIDEVAIYDYPLTGTQIANHFTTGANTTLGVSRINILNTDTTNLLMTWPSGTLQSAPSAEGPFIDLTNAVSPYYLAPALEQEYFRVKVQ